MAIILKNNLDGLVTYNTNVPSGSGYVNPNGRTAVMPKGTTQIWWTVQSNTTPSGFSSNAMIAPRDGYVYTIGVTEEPIEE